MFNFEKTKDPTEVHAYQTRIVEGTNITCSDIEKLWSSIKNW